MKIEQIKSEELKRVYDVSLSASELDQKVSERLTEISGSIRLPGFRPGKAPLALLKSKYGKSVMGEVLEKAVNDGAQKAINENKLRPAMRPQIEVKKFDEAEGLEYTMTIEVLPEIALGDFSHLAFNKNTAKVEDKEIDEALNRIAKNQRTSEKVTEDRASKIGDIVVIDFDGTVDGKALPGMKGESYQLELGSKSFVDNFEDQLVGLKAGADKMVTVTFPANYPNAELASKEAKFAVKVKEIRVPELPAIDDAFAKTLGFEALDKVKDAIRGQMQNEFDQITRMVLKRDLLDALDKEYSFNVPQGMVDAEFKAIWQQVKGHAYDHKHDENCGHDHNKDKEDEAEYKTLAVRRVKLGLILAEVGRDKKVEVSMPELQQAVIKEAQMYPGREREVFEYYQKNQGALEALRAPIYEDKVVDLILETAKITDNNISIEDLRKLADDAESSGK
jgi:trigger factor